MNPETPSHLTIHIFTAGFGEGHNSAAKGLHAAIEELAPAGVRSMISDPFALAYPKLNGFLRKGYIGAINRAPKLWSHFYGMLDRGDMVSHRIGGFRKMRKVMERLIAENPPAALVSVYPAYSYVLAEMLGKEAGEIPRITIITDSITVNKVWLRSHSDAFIVANPETAEVVKESGVNPEKILTLGFPVHPKFSRLAEEHLAPVRTGNRKWKLLYMINSGKDHAPDLVAHLRERDDIELVVTVGRDKALEAKIQKVAAKPGAPTQILGWTDEMPRLMMESDLLIGKAGGATVQEAIAARCPMIVSQVVPGQEEGNALLIESIGCGAISEAPNLVHRRVDQALANEGAELQRWHAAVGQASKPSAALDIAWYLVGKFAEPQ